jgi:sugar lactone lactonase YvrE|tara:strand:- start:79 stop:966 length:888 start_codon:yes stop_codon:yes gene_type:complete
LKIKTSKPECIWKSNTILGEGTLWVKSHNSIYFVDIKRKKIFILNTKNKKKKILKVNKEIGFLSHIKNNIFILGLKGELRIVNLKTRKIIKSIIVEKNKPLNRLNDGKTDPKGRLWFGSMDNLERKIRTGLLYCLDNNLNLTEVDKNYYITNGPAFINSENFYHTDSRDKKIYKIKINKKLKIIKKKVFIKFKNKEGSPDGMTLDKKNNLWTCHFGGACISVFNKTGNKIHKIDLPAKNITNCTFGGSNNSELFVTSAKKSLSKKDLRQFKLSGSLFRIKTNVNGTMAKRFNYNI